jgi:hypothetical protein
MNIWDILGIIAIAAFVLSWGLIGKNAIGGGLTAGVLIGLIVGVINLIMGNGFDWFLVRKIITIGILAGFVLELMYLLSRKNREGRALKKQVKRQIDKEVSEMLKRK